MEEGRVLQWHPLLHHCADVAACAEAILQTTLLRKRLARIGATDHLSPAQVARLSALALLHDVGKYAIGFQNKSQPGRTPVCGHLHEVLALLFEPGHPETALAWEALGLEEIFGWGDDMGALIAATVSHHGRPVRADGFFSPCWTPTPSLDPFAGMAELSAHSRRWFPEAWAADSDPVPTNPEFQHAWSGLVNLADWIGSDSRRFFRFSRDAGEDRMRFARETAGSAVREIGLATNAFRENLGVEAIGYSALIGSNTPRPAQARMLEVTGDAQGSLTVLEAETGSGKTEAALLHFLRLYQGGHVDGLYFALPLRAAAVQIHDRVRRAVAATFPSAARPPVVLAVPGYRRVDEVDGVPLASFETYWPEDDESRMRYRGWAAENPKRFLAGAVVVGTVDQVLLSSLVVRHAHLRATSLLRHLLVVDEVHASDVYMGRLLEDVLRRHLGAGGHALVMSATLGSSLRSRLLRCLPSGPRVEPPGLQEAMNSPYPLISVASRRGRSELAVDPSKDQKRIELDLVPILDRPDEVAERALEAAREGARVLIVRNTVRGCQEVQIALEDLAGSDDELLFRCSGRRAPHHSRYAKGDRALLDQAIEAAFGRTREAGGLIAVATQTVEQSLDLDADFMLTDLCPMDVLLQRIGRLHRHDRSRPARFASARVVLFVPTEPELTTFIGANGEGQGRHGLGRVYRDLRTVQATWDLLRDEAELSIPADNRRAVELCTHPETLESLVAKRGEAWELHQRQVHGVRAADQGIATLNLVSWDQPFGDLEFPRDRQAPTRLGENDRLAQFEPAVDGPFDQPFSEVTIPWWLAADAPADLAEAQDVEVENGVVTFSYGPRRFAYDRLGLREVPR